MRKTITVSLFVLLTLTWALAQTPGSQGQTGSQPPDAAESSPSTPGQAPSAGAQTPAQPTGAPVIEGCLSGADPTYTITDKAGTKYKLNFPPNANISVLSQHVGESVQVIGDVNKDTITVMKIGRGTGACSGGGSAAPPQSRK